MTVEAVNMLIAGVNAGLHYAKMFGIPTPKDTDELFKEYHDIDSELEDEVVRLMKESDDLSNLIDEDTK